MQLCCYVYDRFLCSLIQRVEVIIFRSMRGTFLSASLYITLIRMDVSCPGSILLDRKTLLVLFGVTGGSAWRNNQGWNTSLPTKEWYGVILNAEDRVVELDLGWNNLRGEYMLRFEVSIMMWMISCLSGRVVSSPRGGSILMLFLTLHPKGGGICGSGIVWLETAVRPRSPALVIKELDFLRDRYLNKK